MSVPFPWNDLPCEIKCEIVDMLGLHDIRRLATGSQATHNLCVPKLFQKVKLESMDAFSSFVRYVPRTYRAYIRELEICTKPEGEFDLCAFEYESPPPVTDELVDLLDDTPELRCLTLCIYGSLGSSIIPTFSKLHKLERFAISNWAEEHVAPLSERLVVAMAYALRAIDELSLIRVTRSKLHAPDLECNWTVPTVDNDGDIPSPPELRGNLHLPTLLRIPTLRRLHIRETHLGDPMWSAEARASAFAAGEYSIKWDACAPLEALEVGAYPLEDKTFNQDCTQRIYRNVINTITSFSLSAPLSPRDTQDTPFADTQMPGLDLAHTNQVHHSNSHVNANTPAPLASQGPTVLPRLRSLQLTPLVPVTDLITTLSQPQLSHSPVHTISCAFHPDDAALGYAELAKFLGAHIVPDRESTLPGGNSASSGASRVYRQLKRIRVSTDPTDATNAFSSGMMTLYSPSMYAPNSTAARKLDHERREAARRLRALCAALGLEAIIDGGADDALGRQHQRQASDVLQSSSTSSGNGSGNSSGSIKGSRGRSKTA